MLTNLLIKRTRDDWYRPVSGDLSMLTQTTSDIYVISFSLYGLMNAVLTVIFVAPYRQHLSKRLFCRSPKSIVVSQVSTTISSGAFSVANRRNT